MSISLSRIFNENLYLLENPDVSQAVQRGEFSSGRQHFRRVGKFENRFYSFNETYYLSLYSDVAAAVRQGVVSSGAEHYRQFGKTEGRVFRPFYNEEYYLSLNRDVAEAVEEGDFETGLDHFLKFGALENRDYSPLFDNSFYLAQNADVAEAVRQGEFGSGVEHYLRFGQAEGRAGIGNLVVWDNLQPLPNGGLDLPSPFTFRGFEPRELLVPATIGSDVLIGSNINDILVADGFGPDGRPSSIGSPDVIIAGAGNDILIGGEGTDIYFGEAGNDFLPPGNDTPNQTPLTPDQVVSLTTPTNATGVFNHTPELNLLPGFWNGSFSGLSSPLLIPPGSQTDIDGNPPSAVQLHYAPAGLNGPLVRNFQVVDNGNGSGTFSGNFRILPEDVAVYASDYWYVVVYTQANPQGEIRGQLRITYKEGLGDDRKFGGEGDDVLTSGIGNEIMSGGLGNDTLSGGEGNDTFVLGPGEGTDIIYDFNYRGIPDAIALSNGLRFADLVITQGTGSNDFTQFDSLFHTQIRVESTNELLAVLAFTDANTITAADFTRF